MIEGVFEMMNCGMEMYVTRIDNKSVVGDINRKMISVDTNSVVSIEEYVKMMTVNAVKWIKGMLLGIEHTVTLVNEPFGMGLRVIIPELNERDYVLIYID